MGKMITIKLLRKEVELVKIDHDTNGNPRYVIHWLNIPMAQTYNDAVVIMRGFGGKKYRAKWYGGGIVFQSPSPEVELNKYFSRWYK